MCLVTSFLPENRWNLHKSTTNWRNWKSDSEATESLEVKNLMFQHLSVGGRTNLGSEGATGCKYCPAEGR